LSGETIDAEITMTFSEEFSCTPRHTVCNAGSAVCSDLSMLLSSSSRIAASRAIGGNGRAIS